MKILTKLGALALVALLIAPSQAATWQIDTAHSSVTFKVRHMLSKTSGQFNDWSGTIVAGDDLTKGSVEVTIQTASVDTRDEKRDNHLRTDDFFDVEKYPTMTFKSTKVEKVGEGFQLHGDLTMVGVTKPVVIDFEFLGTGTDPWGNTKAGFAGTTKINRKDFGIVYNAVLDQGGMLLGDDIEIQLDIAAAQVQTGR